MDEHTDAALQEARERLLAFTQDDKSWLAYQRDLLALRAEYTREEQRAEFERKAAVAEEKSAALEEKAAVAEEKSAALEEKSAALETRVTELEAELAALKARLSEE